MIPFKLYFTLHMFLFSYIKFFQKPFKLHSDYCLSYTSFYFLMTINYR